MGLNTVVGTLVGLIAVVMGIIAFYSPLAHPKHIVLALWIITILLSLIAAYNLTRAEDTDVEEIRNTTYKS
jgi:uncharacterized membrane protein HdeD (DUF308 family)